MKKISAQDLNAFRTETLDLCDKMEAEEAQAKKAGDTALEQKLAHERQRLLQLFLLFFDRHESVLIEPGRIENVTHNLQIATHELTKVHDRLQRVTKLLQQATGVINLLTKILSLAA